MAVIGIDLGTTNSLVAVFTEDGSQLVPNAAGSVLTPSVVSLSDAGEMVVGEQAKHRLISHPKKTVSRFKRYMGAAKEFKFGRKKYRAEDLSALILKSLKADAEHFLGEPVEHAVISVPAYFNDVQRKAVYAAGKIAGLKVDRLVNEPTAAALAYGLGVKDDDTTFLVVDLGGGTFDVSILEVFDKVMEVRSSAGDAFLGGEDFTDLIVKEFGKQIGPDFEILSELKKGLLYQLASQAKEKLSEAEDVTVRFQRGQDDMELTLTRQKFEEISKPLLARLRKPIQRVIMDAQLRAADIDKIILVGGATRMPIIKKMVTKLLGKFPEYYLDPDEVVAIGAGVQAGLVERHEALGDVVMTDVCPFTLGTEIAISTGPNTVETGHFQPIIERNTVIPASRVVRNATLRPGQPSITLHIYQGESPRVVDNVKLGDIIVSVPLNNKECEEIDIRFTYDVSGVLEIIVTTVSDGRTQRRILEGNPGSLSQAEIDKRFKELSNLKIHPRQKSENSALIARLKASYENHLGDMRDHINQHLTMFETTLEAQNETDIELARTRITEWLNAVDSQDVF